MMAARLDADQLAELLGEQHEYEGLDYKSGADLGVQRDLVELTKDLGAMSAEGGYIVVGADDDGTPVGIDGATVPRDFDEARLRGRVRRYLPDIHLRSAVHDVDGLTLAVIWVGQHPDGFTIFATDGQYESDNRQQVAVFREGDVFIRRGLSSLRVGHQDMVRLRQRFVEQERTRVRREWAADLTAAEAPVVERPRITWEAEIGDFVARAEDLVRTADTVPIRLLLARIKPVVSELIHADDLEGLRAILDRAICLLALALLLESEWLFDASTTGLSEVYEAGHQRFGQPTAPGLAAEQVWLEVASRVFAAGGLAVRQMRWNMVRRLATEPGDRERFAELGRSWLMHALVYATRRKLLQHEVDGRQKDLSILKLAEEQAVRLACLRPDERVDGEAVFNSVCQFDALQCLAVLAAGIRATNAYPNFGQFHANRSEPAIERIILDAGMRETVAPMSDQDLADAIRYLSQTARRSFFMMWDGFDSTAIERFLRKHPPTVTA